MTSQKLHERTWTPVLTYLYDIKSSSVTRGHILVVQSVRNGRANRHGSAYYFCTAGTIHQNGTFLWSLISKPRPKFDYLMRPQSCSRVVPSCPDLSRPVLTCHELSQVVSSCPELFRAAQNYSVIQSCAKKVSDWPTFYRDARVKNIRFAALIMNWLILFFALKTTELMRLLT